jgi:fido (protein-threonine AMPylation protein)
MKPKFLAVLDEALSRGISYGIVRAHKYNDNPTDQDLEMHIHQQVMNEIYEWFDFEELNGK